MEALELWPSLIGVHQYGDATNINPLFQRVFMAMRATDPEYSESDTFYASRDDLLHRVKLNEWNQFLEFAAGAVRDTAKKANHGVWPQESVDLQIQINGIWFQISNNGAHHDIHTHGNCSWSAVYVVDVDPNQDRVTNTTYHQMNGITRFYSPCLSGWVALIWTMEMHTSRMPQSISIQLLVAYWFFRLGCHIRRCHTLVSETA